MGIKTIMQAKKILVIASGEDKAQIVKEAFFGTSSADSKNLLLASIVDSVKSTQ